jgi:hypothetical protein
MFSVPFGSVLSLLLPHCCHSFFVQDASQGSFGGCGRFWGILVGSGKRGGKVPEKKLQDLLQTILRDDLEVEPRYYITSVRTFEEAGVPTEDRRGLLVTMSDGSEYRITIVKSR